MQRLWTQVFGQWEKYNCCHCDHESTSRPQFIEADDPDAFLSDAAMQSAPAMGSAQRTPQPTAGLDEQLERSTAISKSGRTAEAMNGDTADKKPATEMPEREQLQQDVKVFAQKAVKGIDCTLMRSEGPVAARLMLDRQLQRLTVLTAVEVQAEGLHGQLQASSPTQGLIDRNVHLGSIEGIYRFEAARNLFPYLVEELPMPDADQEKAVVVLLGLERDKEPIICLLEKDNEAREKFMMCLKILRLYVQTAGVSHDRQSPAETPAGIEQLGESG